MLDENPVLSELLEETRIAMVEARESLAREPTDSARATALAAISAKNEKLQKALEEETPARFIKSTYTIQHRKYSSTRYSKQNNM